MASPPPSQLMTSGHSRLLRYQNWSSQCNKLMDTLVWAAWFVSIGFVLVVVGDNYAGDHAGNTILEP
ncbi:hypothetical protein P691DRAFT_765417 [Macrolepiota fuliginosa MF-IS2]|uniref:Uncharacterized protein n=1 Tax=Macrolepiota fuliginosa MF-IS2 TaxID=1400762 RepID=A0A9P5X2K2_9AGAR|nr:hypothetical protein P691DRAFT_765417 [Macrolepiota fuliginosa MF-IS2]